MAAPPRLIAIVDDDESIREALPDFLRSYGFEAAAFGSAEAFLAWPKRDSADCLILDAAMPGMTGPQLQKELARRGARTPIVFMTGQNRPGFEAEVLRQGAVACLDKPFSETAILAAVQQALRQ